MAKDFYKILGVSKKASQDEIKKAFKQLAKKYHPDINKGKDSEEKFKELNEAFQILNDPIKRNQYDQFGEADFNSQDFNSQGFDFNDIFRDFGFGEFFGFGKRQKEENSNLRYDLEITFEDAFSGLRKTIEVPQFVSCTSCKGTGAKSGYLKECLECGGAGEYKKIQRTVFGQVISIATCAKCEGSGNIIAEKCEKCGGNKKIKQIKKIEVEIPKGIDNEQYIKIPTDSGNIYVVIYIKQHKIFDRDAENLFCSTFIDVATAVFGGEIEIPTINSKAKLKISPGTQSHTIFRLKNQGMPILNSNKRGDQFVKVIVKIPEKLTKKEEEALKMAFSDHQKVETKKGFFEKLREFV
ncbi:molecular chaperone DnaJ [Candidatus Woesearchaeota archaeon]|nr:molecular chaperone DnaJ [Candidatus Woesearchaeota archaeon]